MPTSQSVSFHAGRCRPFCALTAPLLLTALSFSALLASTAATAETAAERDWVPVEQLPPERRETLGPGCCGAFVEPPGSGSGDPAESALEADADRTELLRNERTVILEGDVQVRQGYRTLNADRAIYRREQQQLQLEGEIELREPGTLVTGVNAEINLDTNELQLDDVSYLLHDSRAHGQALSGERQDNGVVVLENSTYSTCEPGDTDWQIHGDEIRLDPNTRQGTAKGVTLRAGGLPVFYAPYLQFPLGDERMSGLLFPSFAYGDKNGFDYAQPYYLNLAPNYDATLTPRYLSERGAMLEAEGRYLSPWFATTVAGGYLPDDDGGAAEAGNTEQPYAGKDRWLFSVDQQGGFNAPWGTLIDVTAVSDNDYFRDLGTSSLEVNSQTHLLRLGQASYQLPHWWLGLRVQQYQTIVEGVLEPYKERPRLTANGGYDLAEHWQVQLNHEVADFAHDDANRVIGQRGRLDYQLGWQREWLPGFVGVQGRVRHLRYDLDQTTGPTDPDVTVPSLSLDGGLFFEREVDNTTLQTLEPRLYYVYSDYQDQSELPLFDTGLYTFSYQQLFRPDRFSGGDRIGDANRLSLGVTSRSIDREQGRERWRASVGQIVYFEDRRVSLSGTPDDDARDSTSAIAAEVQARLSQWWSAQGDLLWDPNAGQFDQGAASLRYRDDDYRLLNVSYRYRREANLVTAEDIDQTDVSAVLPITAQWALIGRWRYDLAAERDLETLAGLEYSDCCWRLTLVWRRWVDNTNAAYLDPTLPYNKGLFLEFQLRGLGGVGNRMDSMLGEGIWGYDQRAQALAY